MPQSSIVDQGMTQVLTGLGILIGAGAISNTTHAKILNLLNHDECHDTAEGESIAVKEETPCEVDQEERVLLDYAPREPFDIVDGSDRHLDHVQPPTWNQEPLIPEPASATTATVVSKLDKPTSNVKIICPWWLTQGYNCRDQESGKCPMIHELVSGGAKDPLICYFWANGDRCSKNERTCRFAHYLAPHRIVAPIPMRKKVKKPLSTFGDSSVCSGSTKLHSSKPKDSDDVWRWGLSDDIDDDSERHLW